MSEIKNAISKLALFEGLSDEEIKQIASLCSSESFRKGECIIEEQTPGRDLYVVLRRSVSIQVESITPKQDVAISTIGSGQIFGEMSLIDREPRSANATCNENTDVIIINGDKLKSLFNENHHIGYVVMTNIAKTICSRIRKTNRRLLNLMRISLI